MTINPRDYDLEELRRLARAEGDGDDVGEPRQPSPDVELPPETNASAEAPDPSSGERSDVYRDLVPFLHDEPDKPYLTFLPESYAAEVLVFEWLDELTQRGGYHGAVEALDYYASVDWITDDVRATLSDYLLGVEESGHGAGDASVDDHLQSLVYVAELHAMTE